jgi:hypothetical protein
MILITRQQLPYIDFNKFPSELEILAALASHFELLEEYFTIGIGEK